MKIHLLSDIHVEFWKDDWRYELQYLIQPVDVLAGGIHETLKSK